MVDFVDKLCAVCQLSDGLIINVIIASSSYPAPDGCQLVEIMADQRCDLGWCWDGINFVPPASEVL